MTSRLLRSLVLAVPFIAACGVIPDVRLGAESGIPEISGSTTIAIPQGYKCGDPVTDPKGQYQVTSSGTVDKCVFVFNQKVTALKSSDYDTNPQLQGARAVNAIDLEVSKFALTDPSTGKEPKGLLSLDGKAFGETILTEKDLQVSPPFTKTLDGEAVDALKDQVVNKKDIVIPVDVNVAVSLADPPAEISLDFTAQPVLAIGF
ncbi:MAG: hypothetical protein U0441_10280 [Polyangiaceae bacterium]